MTFVHQITLTLAVAALAGAGFRLAGPSGVRGLPRALVAIVFGATLAVFEAMVLGLVDLGGSTIALAVAAVLTWAASTRLVPAAEGPAPHEELLTWWSGAPLLQRVALGACAGAWAIWAAWLARHPLLGADSMIYHVPEVVEWVHNGSPGAVSELFPGYPVGSYPITNEVLMAWASGISRSFVPVMLWAPLTLGVLALGSWTGLRTVGVARVPAALATLTLCLTPPLTHWQKNGAHTDLPAMAWLVAAGALCAASVRRPGLLPAVVLAVALAIGTKTTTMPLGFLVLAIAAYVHRARLRALWRPLALACAAGLVVGGFWYLRNLVDHGSPLWPFVAAPWGDPEPEVIAPSGEVVEQVYTRFLDTPMDTLDFLLSNWAKPFAGGFALIAFGLLAPLAARSRAVLASTLVTAVSLLLWTAAPFTGISEGDAGEGALTTARYLLPTFTAAALTLCLVAREGRLGRAYSLATLAIALGLTAWQLFDLGYPSVPSVTTVLAGAAIGAALAGVAALIPLRGWPRAARLAVVPVGAVALALALSAMASNFVERYTQANASEARKLFSASTEMFEWFLDQDEYEDGDDPIAFTVVMNAALAGDRLQHRIDLVSALEECPRVRERLREGWVIVNRSWPNKPCYGGLRPLWSGGEFRVYRAAPEALAEDGR